MLGGRARRAKCLQGIKIRGIEAKKLKYIEAYCPGGSQFLRNCTLLQCLPVQGFISKILSRGEGIVT